MEMRIQTKARGTWLVALSATLLCFASGLAAQEGRKAIMRGEAVYPDIARPLQLAGTVKIQVTIAKNGEIKEAKVLGGPPIFVSSALEALKKWKYAPSATETTSEVDFNFRP
jgi:TonB family protein